MFAGIDPESENVVLRKIASMAAEFDYYKILGVKKDASKSEIRKAYKKLSKQYHPDVRTDDADAVKKFKDVQRAWEVLGNDEKRGNYDRYGSPDGPRFGEGRGRSAADDRESRGWSPDRGEVPFDFEDLFSGFRSQQAGGYGNRQGAWPVRGQDARTTVEIPFMLAAEGGQYELRLQRDSSSAAETLTLAIPAGVDSGTVIRLSGQGSPGVNQGQSGDLLVTIMIAGHPWFRREEANVLLDLPISITECAVGAKVDIPTLRDGIVSLTDSTGNIQRNKVKTQGERHPRSPHGKTRRHVGDRENRGPKNIWMNVRGQLLNELNGTLLQAPRAGLWGTVDSK